MKYEWEHKISESNLIDAVLLATGELPAGIVVGLVVWNPESGGGACLPVTHPALTSVERADVWQDAMGDIENYIYPAALDAIRTKAESRHQP